MTVVVAVCPDGSDTNDVTTDDQSNNILKTAVVTRTSNLIAAGVAT